MAESKVKKYTLGSGDIHIEEIIDNQIPENFDEFFASTENRMGEVKGGAQLEYTVETFEDQSDLGRIKIREITAENVTLTSGMATWDGNMLKKLCETAEVTTGPNGRQTIKIGGLSKKKDKRYLVGFEHYSKKIRVIIVGNNIDGFTLSFMQDTLTVVDVKFAAEALDDTGTLVIIEDLREETTTAEQTRTAANQTKAEGKSTAW